MAPDRRRQRPFRFGFTVGASSKRILKGLFADGPFSFSGDHYTITELEGRPTPVQRPRPPIMIGGGGPLDDVCQKLTETRQRYGISYFAAPIDARPEVLAPVIAALADPAPREDPWPS